jgi:succinate-acetate transporter protein
MCIALTGWMFSMSSASWFPKVYARGVSIAYPLAIVLVVMGILSFLQSRALDAIIFFGVAALGWADYTYFVAANSASSMDPSSYTGWFAFIWAVFFCYVWFRSFRSGILRLLFLLGLCLTLLALAIGDWGSLHAFVELGGYLGLATSILAAITSAVAIIRYGWKNGDANQEAEIAKPSTPLFNALSDSELMITERG